MSYITDEERQILAYLKTNPTVFLTIAEICRHATNRRTFEENPHWALPYLRTLEDKHLVERDDMGHYRIVLRED